MSIPQKRSSRQRQGFVLSAEGTCEACGDYGPTYFDGVRHNSKTGEPAYLYRECWVAAYGQLTSRSTGRVRRESRAL